MLKITTLILFVSSSLGFVSAGHAHVKPLKTGYYYVVSKPNQFKRQLKKTKEVYFLNPTPIVTAKQFAKIMIAKDGARHNNEAVIKFTDAGSAAFSVATKKYLHKQIALVIDDQVIQVPTVQNPMDSGIASFNGDYANEDLEHLVNTVKAEMK